MSCVDCATAECYTIGQQASMTVSFATAAGLQIAPTTITFDLLAPDGTETTAGIGDAVNPSLGVYVWTPPPLDQLGYWYFRATTTGNLVTVAESVVHVGSIWPTITA